MSLSSTGGKDGRDGGEERLPDAAELSNDVLRYRLGLRNGVSAETFGLAAGGDWGAAGARPGRDFAVYSEGLRIDGGSDGLAVTGLDFSRTPSGASVVAIVMLHKPTGLEIRSHHIVYAGTPVLEKWITVRNTGEATRTIDRLDSFELNISPGNWRLMSFRSDWGAEFEPEIISLDRLDGVTLETRQGRSSKTRHPWMALVGEDGELLAVSPMWSGNWILRCEREEDGGYSLSGGLHDWEFRKELAHGESLESPHVVLTPGNGGDLNSVSVPLANVGREHWYPRNALSLALPVEWNPWWCYEDKRIDEATFLANADRAAELGIEVCTMDAGWFGPSDEGTFWFDYRGDWELVNRRRFPGGIEALADAVHSRGMKFGLWCEIEGLGRLSRLAAEHSAFAAERDGESLGYVCFGNPEAREWAYATLDRLIRDYRCDWIKLDFNLEPHAGCSRTDHGHGSGDGLYVHYRGYYEVLDRIRKRHPDVLLENCASGGLRIDLGMMKHTHTTFLSDPDWPEHSLQLFWGATTSLAPDVCLHWSYSEWLGDHPCQKFDPRDPALEPYRFDYYTRIAMLGGFGLSQRLPDLPTWVAERLAVHIRDYRDTVRRYVREAELYRLTAQPLREGRGDRWAGFQYRLAEEDSHLLFVFRLPGGETERSLRLYGLRPDAEYELRGLSGDVFPRRVVRGSELLNGGLRLDWLREEESALLILSAAK